MYVNLVDNHYPYDHEALDPLLGVDPVSRSEIREENAQRVFDTYLQAAANVDRSIGQLLELWRQHTGEAPLLVTADHGQSFYENGLLGHGQTVDDAQARVPLIVVGLGGQWPEPLAVSDLRGLILANLFEGAGRALFRLDARRSVFHYIGPPQQPRLVALRDANGASLWHFQDVRDSTVSENAVSEELVRRVIWTWESLQREMAAREQQRDDH
jgi:hypothetical protein